VVEGGFHLHMVVAGGHDRQSRHAWTP
jgi:hypothetical protein